MAIHLLVRTRLPPVSRRGPRWKWKERSRHGCNRCHGVDEQTLHADPHLRTGGLCHVNEARARLRDSDAEPCRVAAKNDLWLARRNAYLELDNARTTVLFGGQPASRSNNRPAENMMAAPMTRAAHREASRRRKIFSARRRSSPHGPWPALQSSNSICA
jgi:hypothetical protein